MQLTVAKTNVGSVRSPEVWNCRDILLYFARRWSERTGKQFLIPKESWPGFMSRIATFQRKAKLTGPEYKQFIDDIIDKLFITPGTIPEFGSIVSEKVLWLSREKEKHSPADFVKLRTELYRDSLLWSRVK
jgi:hypothetical protein